MDVPPAGVIPIGASGPPGLQPSSLCALAPVLCYTEPLSLHTMPLTSRTCLTIFRLENSYTSFKSLVKSHLSKATFLLPQLR